MKASLDRFGRVVVPKDIRDRQGPQPGRKLRLKESAIVLKPVEQGSSVMMKEGILVFSGTATGNI